MREPIKIERIQWPVGHGGFHTGRLRVGKRDFRYFFDCGSHAKEGKALIKAKFEAPAHFRFGVISHFDHDHFSELVGVNVETLFLPYMTETEMVYQACTGLAKGMSLAKAFAGFGVLRNLRSKGTRIVMVNGLLRDPDANALQGPQIDSDELFLSVPAGVPHGTGITQISHDAAVDVRQDAKTLLIFKFFNYQSASASTEFADELEKAVLKGLLKKADKTPYNDVKSFLTDVSSGDSWMVSSNGKALKAIYEETLRQFKEKGITESNLSSLTMFCRTATSRHDHIRRLVRTQVVSQPSTRGSYVREDGWMLTGDLELTPKVWDAFNSHYFHDLPQCTTFNVPHHASAISLCEEATVFLRDQLFVMPVKAEDPLHPAKVLQERLARHNVGSSFSVTTAWESLYAVVSLLE